MIPDILIIVLFIGLWLAIKELPVILGSSFSAGIIRERYIPLVIVFSMIPVVFFPSDIIYNISGSSALHYPPTILVICFGSAISVWIVSLFTKWTSVVYALIAAIFAWVFYTDNYSSVSFFIRVQ